MSRVSYGRRNNAPIGTSSTTAEGVRPDRWNAAGMAICLTGAGAILFAPRGTA